MLTVILSVLAGLSAVLTIIAKYRPSKRLESVCKPLTMVLILLIAVLDGDPISTRYKVLIAAGLAVSLLGDVLLMLPGDRLLHGLAAFLVAHLLYIAAFTLEGSGDAPLWYIIPFALYGVIILWRLWPTLGHMRAPALIYTAVILIMAWQAANRWIETEQEGSLLALAGAYLFVLSDSALSIERFRGPFRSAAFWVLATYFAAQWLIALSV